MTYFAIIFGVGFALGTIRVLLVVPRVGVRTAELMEEPIMFVVIFMTARWLVRRFTLESLKERLGAGFIGLGLLLAAEYAWLPGARFVVARGNRAARRRCRDGLSGDAAGIRGDACPDWAKEPRPLVVRGMRGIKNHGNFYSCFRGGRGEDPLLDGLLGRIREDGAAADYACP